MSYQVIFKKTALKQLIKLPKKIIAKIKIATEKLAANPNDKSLNIKALQGLDAYRLRLGDYRIIYTMNNNVMIIEVIEIFHRQKGY